MRFRVRFTAAASDDLSRLYAFLLEREDGDWRLAERALAAIGESVGLLEHSRSSCRKACAGDSFLSELLISFGRAGDVALFEIEDAETATVLAVRHQREEDYH